MLAGWLEAQWSVILIPCLIGLAQQSIDTLLLQDLCDYKKAGPMFGSDYLPQLSSLVKDTSGLHEMAPA